MPWNWLRAKARHPTARIERGERGEEVAARHLRRAGYKVLVRRFQSRHGEIDLVCRQGEWLVFVEVKTRASEEFGAPSEAVDHTKQERLSRAALEYLRLLHHPRVRWRFDVVEVLWPTEAAAPTEVRVIQNAFDLREPFLY